MTKRSLILKLFLRSIHAAGIKGYKEEEFHWVGLLATDQAEDGNETQLCSSQNFLEEMVSTSACHHTSGPWGRDAPASADSSHHPVSDPDPAQAPAGKIASKIWKLLGFLGDASLTARGWQGPGGCPRSSPHGFTSSR